MGALFAAYAIFFAGFEQGGASLNLFAERYTDRNVFGWRMPAGRPAGRRPRSTPSCSRRLSPLCGSRSAAAARTPRLRPSSRLALTLLAAGYLVMYVAAGYVAAGAKVLPTWLLFTYFLQECGDLCLSPVGLSSMTKLAPPRFVGQVMGLWFLALALGNNLAGQLSGEYDAHDLQSLPALFLKIAGGSLVTAVVMLALTPTVRRLDGPGQVKGIVSRRAAPSAH